MVQKTKMSRCLGNKKYLKPLNKKNMATKEPGYVYILTNPSFREDWVKIGKSSRPVDVRSKELDNTAVPLPFEIFATMKTVKYNEAEKLVHRYIERFTNLRIRNNREFFNVKPEEALEIFKEVAMLLDDAEICEVHKGGLKSLEVFPTKRKKGHTHRPAMNFYQMGMQKGDIIKWKDNPSIIASIYTDRKVLFDGKVIALSALTRDLRNANYYVVAGAYWTFNGRLLTEIYEETYPFVK